MTNEQQQKYAEAFIMFLKTIEDRIEEDEVWLKGESYELDGADGRPERYVAMTYSDRVETVCDDIMSGLEDVEHIGTPLYDFVEYAISEIYPHIVGCRQNNPYHQKFDASAKIENPAPESKPELQYTSPAIEEGGKFFNEFWTSYIKPIKPAGEMK